MTGILLDAEVAAEALASGAWQTQLPSAVRGGDGCGSGLTGFSAELAHFVQPLVQVHEMVSGDPGGLYHASYTWEVYAGDVQEVSIALSTTLGHLQGDVSGVTADVVENGLTVLSRGTHAIADWSKVVSQVLQTCVRVVEIMRSLVCAGYELLSSAAGAVSDILFGSFPWEIDRKMGALHEFADNCANVIDTVVSNVDRVLQLLRELVRLVLDLYRAVIPFHQWIEDQIGQALHTSPPGDLPGVSEAPMLVPKGGTFGDLYTPSKIPYPGSEQEFSRQFDFGYQHTYDLGPTTRTTEEMNEMLRVHFGHVFGPSRVGDNSQINSELSAAQQEIATSLMGLGIPGVTAGEIEVTQLTDDGFVVRAAEGHPEYPGEVAFRIRNADGHAIFEVTGAYDETILDKLHFEGNTNATFALISDVAVWSDMKYRLKDMMNYGE